MKTKFCSVAPKFFFWGGGGGGGSSVWELFHVTFEAPRILVWFLYFWKISCGPTFNCPNTFNEGLQEAVKRKQ